MQAVYSPHNIMVFAELGNEFELTGQGAAAYVGKDEQVSYWQLQVTSSLGFVSTCSSPGSGTCGTMCMLWQQHGLPDCAGAMVAECIASPPLMHVCSSSSSSLATQVDFMCVGRQGCQLWIRSCWATTACHPGQRRPSSLPSTQLARHGGKSPGVLPAVWLARQLSGVPAWPRLSMPLGLPGALNSSALPHLHTLTAPPAHAHVLAALQLAVHMLGIGP